MPQSAQRRRPEHTGDRAGTGPAGRTPTYLCVVGCRGGLKQEYVADLSGKVRYRPATKQKPGKKNTKLKTSKQNSNERTGELDPVSCGHCLGVRITSWP